MRLAAVGATLLLLPAAAPASADAQGHWRWMAGASGGGTLVYDQGAGLQRERLRFACARPGSPVTLRAATSPMPPGKGVRLRFEDSAGRVATVRGTLHRGPAGLRFSSSLSRDHRLFDLLRSTGTLRMHSEPRGSSDEYELATAAEPLRRFDAGCGGRPTEG